MLTSTLTGFIEVKYTTVANMTESTWLHSVQVDQKENFWDGNFTDKRN